MTLISSMSSNCLAINLHSPLVRPTLAMMKSFDATSSSRHTFVSLSRSQDHDGHGDENDDVSDWADDEGNSNSATPWEPHVRKGSFGIRHRHQQDECMKKPLYSNRRRQPSKSIPFEEDQSDEDERYSDDLKTPVLNRDRLPKSIPIPFESQSEEEDGNDDEEHVETSQYGYEVPDDAFERVMRFSGFKRSGNTGLGQWQKEGDDDVPQGLVELLSYLKG